MLKTVLAISGGVSLLLSRLAPGVAPSVVSTFLLITSFLLSAHFAYRAFLYPFLLSPSRHVPNAPGAHWLLGNFAEIFRDPTGSPQSRWMTSVPNTGLIRYRWLFNTERLMPTSPKTLSEVLQQKSYSFVKPSFMRDGIGRILGLRGILFAEGDVHRHQRKLLLPAFSHAHIKQLVPTFWRSSKELSDKISRIVADGSQVVEMGSWASLATLDIIGRAGFGYDFRAIETRNETGESESELARAYSVLFTPTAGAVVLYLARNVIPSYILRLLPLQANRNARNAAETIKRVSAQIIAEKQQALREKGEDGNKDILSVMLKSGDYEGADGVEVMQDQIMTFLAAGHETTATAMIWGLHLLSLPENRYIQEKLRAEIRAAFPHGMPEDVGYEQIEALKYLRSVTTEVLRLYPPVPLTARHTAEDTTLGGYPVKKGTYIVLVPWAINRSTEMWGPDAMSFRPERWEEEGGQAESNYAFITFLAGPRGCIGGLFAKLEYKCLMAAMIGQFDFAEGEPGRVIVIKEGITSKPQGGIPLRMSIVPGW